MSNQRVVCSGVLALVLQATLGLSCVERDWSLCSPQDECHPGYTCTADWKCVREVDGGADALVTVDSQTMVDGAGRGVDGPVSASADAAVGPAIGQDAGEPDFAPVSTPPDAAVSTGLDGPEPDRAPVSASPDSPADIRPDAPPDAAPDTPVDAVPDAPAAGGPPDAPAADAPPIGPTVDAAGTCSTDKDCSPQNPLCLGNRCAKCIGDSDCAGRSSTPACVTASGLCVACTANKYCTGAARTCDTTTNQCVGCVTRSDCGGVCQTCSSGGVCTAVKNQDDLGFCAGTCDSTGACKSKQGQTCQTAGGGCAAGTTCSADGVCCDTTCSQACRSCLSSKTGGQDGTCANVTNGTGCGGGQYCSGGACGSGCLISGTLYTSGAVSSANPCQTCQPAVSPTSWSPLGNGTSCASGQICSGGNCQTGCWIGGSFIGSGATNSTNICQICNPTKSTSGWSNNDAATAVPCGGCGGTAACSNMVLGSCSKNTATYYQDADGDGYGNPYVTPVVACTAPAGWVSQAGDCDDADSTDYPGATECETYDPNTLTTCSSSGSWVSTTCPNGCAGGQCRTFPFPTVSVAGLVTCGTLQCPTSQGCSFAGGWSGQPVCGSPVKYYNATCDGQNDCPGQECCWISSGGSAGDVGCFPSGTCPHFQMGSNAYLICDPNQAASCPAGSTCTMLSPYSTYYCQPN